MTVTIKNEKILGVILFIMVSAVTLGLLEFGSYLSFTPVERQRGAAKILMEHYNSYVEGLAQRSGCSFSESTIGHSMLGFVHRQPQYLSENCKEDFKVNNIGIPTSRDFPLHKNDDEYSVLILGGSVAGQMAEYTLNSIPYIEDFFNKNFIPPSKKKFKFYAGALGAWAMPNQVNMLLMYGERIDGAIALDGYNEAFPLMAGKRFEQLPAAHHILTNSGSGSFRFKYMNFLWEYRNFISSNYLKSSYFLAKSYQFFVHILQTIVVPQAMIKEFSNANIEEISLKSQESQNWVAGSLERYVRRFHDLGKITHIKTAHFLQPTRLQGKVLTEDEKIPMEHIDAWAIQRIDGIYRALQKEGLPIRSLTDVFKDEKGSIYKDHIHYQPKGNEIVIEKIAEHVQEMWKLKRRR